MVISQGKIANAYKATESLKDNSQFTESVLWNLYKLRKTLTPHVEYQTEREKALQEKYSPYADENGNISGDTYLNFLEDLHEIIDLEKEVDWTPIEIPLVPGLTLGAMEALDDFVKFKEPPSDK